MYLQLRLAQCQTPSASRLHSTITTSDTPGMSSS